MIFLQILAEKSKTVSGVEQWPYRAICKALEIIPKTLAENCGENSIRVLTSLRAAHAGKFPTSNMPRTPHGHFHQPLLGLLFTAGKTTMGVNGDTGALADMKELKIWDPLAVKLQTLKTAVETAILLLRIDDIVSGSKKQQDNQAGGPGAGAEH
jgi:T-complex protein 1 subunit gamma